jgi:hypothetical protein
MKNVLLPAFVVFCALMFAGCVHRQPLVSHAHVGHCLTTWRDTPGRQGLLPVARAELETARREAAAALADDLSGAQKIAHIRNISHALSPDAERLGPGSGYGAIRALEGAIEHLEYAATSDDASANLVTAVAQLAVTGGRILERLRGAAARAKAADTRDVAALDRTALELRAALKTMTMGSAGDEEAGLDQFQAQLEAMLARETNPRYQPLPERFLLGLIRMPNGKWRYVAPHKALARPTYGH